jgi:hypothetical protein
MDNSVLKKRLNTFKSGKTGRLSDVSDDVVMEVLRAWENWPGTAADLYRDLGLSKMQMVTMIQKAKRLVKMGVVPEPEFKEIKLADAGGASGCGGPSAIELSWSEGRVIRFAAVELLVDFLKKVA